MFVPGRPFQSGLMLPSEAPFMWSRIGWAPGLTHNYKTRLERLARENALAYYENR